VCIWIFFDRKILDVMSRNHEPMILAELVEDSGFACSTVIIYLKRLGSEGLVLKEKKRARIRIKDDLRAFSHH
jgi:DNA-binding IclR family transcriptional regulator